MKIVLVNPPDAIFEKKSLTGHEKDPPLGIAYIASSLEGAQHTVQIIDSVGSHLTWNETSEILARSDADLVGITTHTRVLLSALRLANRSKELYPKTPVVLGGHGVFTIEEQILRRIESVDMIVRGEGEETTVELANALEKGQSVGRVAGICHKHNNEVVVNPLRPFIQNLDSLPFPARHLLPMDSYIRDRFSSVLGRESFKGTAIISSRGCPFSCVFCAAARFYGHKWRARSADNVVNEIEQFYSDYRKSGLNGFVMADDNFMADARRVEDICDLLISRDLSHLKWMCDARVDSADEELYAKMYEAGCRILAFGIESGNDRILKSIRKGTTTDMVREAVRKAKATGLRIWGYFLFGLPGDTDETIMDTIRFSEELGIDHVEIHPAQMYPGTVMGKEESVDWLSLQAKEEIDEDTWKETGFAGFHPCVPTYAEREKMKAIMSYITKRQASEKKRRKGAVTLLHQGITDPRRALRHLRNRISRTS